MSLKVLKPGFLSLVQDYGRYAYQSVGVTQSGPMDERAFLWANKLLGNHYNAAQLEISIGGFVAEFTQSTMGAISGADLQATLNDKAINPWQSFYAEAGDIIAFKRPVDGLRSYLAIKGGFDVKQQLASCSTVVREGMGGLESNGSAIQVGDVLPYSSRVIETIKSVPLQFIPRYEKSIHLRFIPNVSVTSVGQKGMEQLLNHTYHVSQQCDRMGYRLSGQAIKTDMTGIISQGISLGTIQLPKDGQPIVLMRDRQTMGGYPILGCVAYLDLPLLAQSGPGTAVSFLPVDMIELESELIEYKKFFGLPF